MTRTNWFDRKFSSIDDNGILPCIIERLEGTSVRLAEKIKVKNLNNLTPSTNGKWSIKKEVGHLIDLEPLWLERMKEIISDKEELKKADVTNIKTHETKHDMRNIFDLINEFRKHRQELVSLLRQVTDEDLNKAAKHPRLGTPMKIIDLAYFVAEHDDHHLAQITILQNDQLQNR